MSQLTALRLQYVCIHTEEFWVLLAKLTSLQELRLEVSASGDPSPLSALTGLSALDLDTYEYGADDHSPFTFTSLQPLSTLRQLEVLRLCGQACNATSLEGLAGLSNLNVLEVLLDPDLGMLRTLEGISSRVKEVLLWGAPDLLSLAGIEGCTSLEELTLRQCGVSSLQPLRGLSSLKELEVDYGCLTSLEGLVMPLQSLKLSQCSSLTHLSGIEHFSALRCLDLCHCGVTSLLPLSQLGERLQSLEVLGCNAVLEEVLDLPYVKTNALRVRWSNVKEVVVAGGVRKACIN
jgi:hypothetical protein